MAVVGVLAFQAIGGAAFGTIGTVIGGVIGNALFNKPPTVRNEGPRLENLKTISSQYGANINEIYGTVRTAGCGVIWGKDVEEVINKSTEEIGKGGGGEVETTNYAYFGTFVILICRGKIDGVPRFWVNSELAFDFSDTNLSNSGGVVTMLEKDGEVYGQRVNLDSDKLKGEITFYFGTDNQPVDPVIEEIEGVGNYTAHRGYAYAVFNKIDLTSTAGKPANYNFEVKRTGVPPINKADYDLVDLSALNSELTNSQILNYTFHGQNGKSIIYNKNDGFIYALGRNPFGEAILLMLNPSVNSGGDTVLTKYRRLKGYDYDFYDWNPNWINDPNANNQNFDKTTYLLKRKIREANNYYMNFGEYLDFSENTLIISTGYAPTGFGNFPTPIYDVSGLGQSIIYLEGAYEQENEMGINKSVLGPGQTNSVVTKNGEYKEIQTLKISNFGLSTREIHIFKGLPTKKNKGYVERYTLDYSPHITFYPFCGFTAYANSKGRFFANGKFYAITHFRNNTTNNDEFYLSTPDNFKYFKFLERPYAENYSFSNVSYDSVTNSCIINLRSTGSDRTLLLIKIKLPGEIVSIKNLNEEENFKFWKDKGLYLSSGEINFNNTRACFIGSALVNNNGQYQGNIICNYNVDTEEINFTEVTDYVINIWNNKNFQTNENTFYNNRNSCLYQPSSLIKKEGKVYLELLKFYGKKFQYDGFSLINMIKEICVKCGLTENDLDFTDLIDDNIRGYTINSESTGRGIIEHLAYVYNFGVVESGGKIKFKNNGNTSIKEFDIKELGVQNYGEEINFEDTLNKTRIDEKTLPERVNFTYSNLEFEYEVDTQEDKMIGTNSVNIISNEIPIVLNADEAKAVVKRVLNNTWIARDKFNFSINYDGIELEPLDVITIKENDFKHNVKITKLERQGGIIKIEGFSENATIYDQSNAVGSSSEQKPRPEIKSIAKTDFKILDIPLIDNNLINDAGFYTGVYPINENDSWTGGMIYSTYDQNIPYSQKLTFTNKLKIGTLQNTINDFKQNIIDCTNYIDVEFNRAITLNAISEEQLFDGGNLCLINKEVLQFQNVEVIGINKYRLTKLLRGRFGTDIHENNHYFGNNFIMIDNSLKNLSKNLTEINKVEFFKTVSFGENNLSEFFTQYTNEAVRIKGLAPFKLNYTRNANNDLILNWKNRARGIITSLETTGDLYDEDGFNFRIYVYNKSKNLVLRTIDTTKTEAIYTASQQISDFGSTQTNIYIEIYKLNKFGQLGYALQATV